MIIERTLLYNPSLMPDEHVFIDADAGSQRNIGFPVVLVGGEMNRVDDHPFGPCIRIDLYYERKQNV